MKPIKITVETLRGIEKTAHRKALVEAGFYKRTTNKIQKCAKDYNRKQKNKKNIFED